VLVDSATYPVLRNGAANCPAYKLYSLNCFSFTNALHRTSNVTHAAQANSFYLIPKTIASVSGILFLLIAEYPQPVTITQ
jgi:hypothetical protein